MTSAQLRTRIARLKATIAVLSAFARILRSVARMLWLIVGALSIWQGDWKWAMIAGACFAFAAVESLDRIADAQEDK